MFAGTDERPDYGESPRTTELYDRTDAAIQAEAIITDGLSLNEIERILI